MGVHHECDDVEEFRTGRWSGGENKMVSAPAPAAAKTNDTAPPVTTKAAGGDTSGAPSGDASGGGKHEATSS